ncbi:hypothetical protein [Priestia megaterium]
MVYRGLDLVEEGSGKEGMEVLEEGVKKIMGVVEVRGGGVGGCK